MSAPTSDVGARDRTGAARDEQERAEAQAAARRLGSPESLVAGVLEIAAARALALDALFRLSSIEWDPGVTSACVECADRPRLLMNPAFVEKWCTTPERLAALLLHELAHVSMGHTRLFPRPTVEQNIACDAVINRELLATAGAVHADTTRFAALFEALYESDKSPWFLLRPPPGWPLEPDWEASAKCSEPLREIHRRLYTLRSAPGSSSVRVDERNTVMYGEIVAALRKHGGGGAGSLPADGAPGGRVPGSAGGDGDDDERDLDPGEVLARLLGGHGTRARERAAMSGGRDQAASEQLADALRPMYGRLAGAGTDPFAHQVERAGRRTALEGALGRLLRRAFMYEGTSRGPSMLTERPIRSVDPSQDRRAPARVALARALGAPRPLLFDAVMRELRPAPRDALVYLDVSGSMFGVLPALLAALIPLRRVLRPRIHVFSTKVMPVRAADFDQGKVPTTGGTSITPVLEHLLVEAKSRRSRAALVITDGYFDSPSDALTREALAAGARIHVGVAGPGPLHDSEAWVASVERLPDISR